MYLLDSDWLIDYLGDLRDAVELVGPLADAGLAFSIVTYMEAFEGTLRKQDPATAQARLHSGLRPFRAIPVSYEIAERCAIIRYDLRTRGRRIRDRALDLLIAATAIEYDLTLVTRNLDDFGDILGLKLYAQDAP